VGGGEVGEAVGVAVAVMGVLSAVGVKILAETLQPDVTRRNREIKVVILMVRFIILKNTFWG
jgi:hypothetical protein